MTEVEVLCVGSITQDRIGIVDHVPGSDERVVSKPFVPAGGGPAATAAVTLARLGVSVGFCGTVGNDAAGDAARDELDREGVDTSLLRVVTDRATTESVVLVERDSGARAIITTGSAEPVFPSGPFGAAWLHADQAGYPAVRRAAAAGSAMPSVSIDGGNHIERLDLRDVALYAPTVDALRHQDQWASPEAAVRELSASGTRRVVATDGAAGSLTWDGTSVVRVPAFAIEAVSTLGAGDVFHGALVAACTWELDLLHAVRFASMTAALSCRALDGRSAIPTRSEVEDALDAADATLAVR